MHNLLVCWAEIQDIRQHRDLLSYHIISSFEACLEFFSVFEQPRNPGYLPLYEHIRIVNKGVNLFLLPLVIVLAQLGHRERLNRIVSSCVHDVLSFSDSVLCVLFFERGPVRMGFDELVDKFPTFLQSGQVNRHRGSPGSSWSRGGHLFDLVYTHPQARRSYIMSVLLLCFTLNPVGTRIRRCGQLSVDRGL